MEWLFDLIAQILLYILKAAPLALLGALIAGWALASLGYFFWRQMRAPLEKKPLAKHFYIAGGVLVVGFGIAAAGGLFGALGYYLWVLLAGFTTGALFHLGMRGFVFVPIAIIAFVLAFAGWLTYTQFQTMVINDPILVMRLRGRETVEDRSRVSLFVRDPEVSESDIYFVYGDTWGLSVDVVETGPDTPWLGVRTYYTINYVVGREEETGQVNTQPIDQYSSMLWRALRKDADSLPWGIVVDEQVRFVSGQIGQDYDFKFDTDGQLFYQNRQQSLEDFDGSGAKVTTLPDYDAPVIEPIEQSIEVDLQGTVEDVLVDEESATE